MTHRNEDSRLKFGIEEEFFILDPETRNVHGVAGSNLMKELEQIEPYFLNQELASCNIEIKTPPCDTFSQAYNHLRKTRELVAKKTHEHGLTFISSATHPFTDFRVAQITPKDYYHDYIERAQLAMCNGLFCGMHVHVGINDKPQRYQTSKKLRGFLPFLLACSTSSPFWDGMNTGLASYRRNLSQSMPFGPLPANFANADEYQRFVDTLIKHGDISQESELFWDIRMSPRFPTVEYRIMDVCSNLHDTMAIAALCVCLVQRLQDDNAIIPSAFENVANSIRVNLWLAQRYDITEGYLIDFSGDQRLSFHEAYDELMNFLGDVPKQLQCEQELAHLKSIIHNGTSANYQRQCYEQSLVAGKSEQQAMHDVVDWLVQETVNPSQVPTPVQSQQSSLTVAKNYG